MMCKAKAWVLALAAGLLLLLIPAQARADVTRLLILNDEQTSETSAAATDVLRRFALYSSWTCTFASSEDVPDTEGYTAVIICTDPNRALNASVALAIQESKLPVFVIGAGGLAELTKTQVYEGSLTLRLQTQANAANDMLLSGNSLLLMKESGESLGGQIFVGAQAFSLCQTAGNITHLAYFDPSQEAQCAFLSTLLQTWLWPYKNSPTAYGKYLVLDRVYPFTDPERLLSLVEMLETENVPYVLCVMPIYANADYPAMKRFCEVLRYAQSRGAGIVMHVPQVTLVNVTVEDLQKNIANAYSAYSRYGVYPLAIEAPDVWLMSEKGQDVLRGWRTVFLFQSDEALFGEKQAENTALRDGHQIVAPAYADATAFTNAYAQAIYLDPTEDIETLRTQVNRLKNSFGCGRHRLCGRPVCAFLSGGWAVCQRTGSVAGLSALQLRRGLRLRPRLCAVHDRADSGEQQADSGVCGCSVHDFHCRDDYFPADDATAAAGQPSARERRAGGGESA